MAPIFLPTTLSFHPLSVKCYITIRREIGTLCSIEIQSRWKEQSQTLSVKSSYQTMSVTSSYQTLGVNMMRPKLSDWEFEGCRLQRNWAKQSSLFSILRSISTTKSLTYLSALRGVRTQSSPVSRVMEIDSVSETSATNTHQSLELAHVYRCTKYMNEYSIVDPPSPNQQAPKSHL